MKLIDKRILILTTYPIKNPQHGGQKRTKAIFDAYSRTFKQVVHSSVYYRGFYKYTEKYDFMLSKTGELQVMQSPLTGDIVCGMAIYDDLKVKHKMKKLLKNLKPDIIHLEQPYSYLGLKLLLKEINISPKIIYGSQNVEAPMKREILESANVIESEVVMYEKLLNNLESDLSRICDLLLACTVDDIKIYKEFGAKNVILSPNGIYKPIVKKKYSNYWNKKFSRLGIEQIILFVGSAHPPNWTGFLQIIGKGLGFIPYNTRMVLAGSISDYFVREIKIGKSNILDSTFWLRASSAGRLKEESLGALINISDVIILPITEGGGSNLKTAEAIVSGKKVVTTSHALRSFEWFKDFPNVWVADDPNTFRKYIVEALRTPFQKRSNIQIDLVKQVEWSKCLVNTVEAVVKL